MDNVWELGSKILEGLGWASIIVIIIKIITRNVIDDKFNDITIIANPSEKEKNVYHSYQSYDDLQLSGEYTLIAPVNNIFKNIKVYEIKLTDKGKLKKGNILYSLKLLEPNRALLLNIYCSCGAPARCIVWEDKSGRKSEYFFRENGFNGNRNHSIIRYKSSIKNYILDFIDLL
ncbi:hypothetical protein [Clostridium sp.]|uniref:hypothetical protein n=1 Tax=Clostridium sp. TaxID=1506 RepID=UPI003217E1E0